MSCRVGYTSHRPCIPVANLNGSWMASADAAVCPLPVAVCLPCPSSCHIPFSFCVGAASPCQPREDKSRGGVLSNVLSIKNGFHAPESSSAPTHVDSPGCLRFSRKHLQQLVHERLCSHHPPSCRCRSCSRLQTKQLLAASRVHSYCTLVPTAEPDFHHPRALRTRLCAFCASSSCSTLECSIVVAGFREVNVCFGLCFVSS